VSTIANPEPVACSQASREALELAARVAASDCTVLIAGESGTGKEVLARHIHRLSARAAQPFVAINCAAIPENMLEAVLFGHEKGAFTGALAAHPGKFEQAQGGTLLLDEISEMPLGLQAKLLRVLQEREVERIGGRAPLALDVRVLATTNRRLKAEVTAARFREDLYYRLNVFPMVLAPLRERRDDILPLAMQLLSTRCTPGQRIPALSADAAHCLLTHAWPGNVRELDNVMQRALILLDGATIEARHIRFEFDEAPVAPAAVSKGQLSTALASAERELILDALRDGQGSRRVAAERLGISPRALRYKLAQLRASGVDLAAACG
jgi:two-component system response regulator FlrC